MSYLPVSMWLPRILSRIVQLQQRSGQLTPEQNECVVELLDLVMLLEFNFQLFRDRVESGKMTDMTIIVPTNLEYKEQLAKAEVLLHELEIDCRMAA